MCEGFAGLGWDLRRYGVLLSRVCTWDYTVLTYINKFLAISFARCMKRRYYLYYLLQQILIDGSGHLLGRLASVVAKAVLNGKNSIQLS